MRCACYFGRVDGLRVELRRFAFAGFGDQAGGLVDLFPAGRPADGKPQGPADLRFGPAD